MKSKYLHKPMIILRELIHRNILLSIKETIKRCKAMGNNAQEPDYIAGLTLSFTPLLYATLKDVFPKTKFSVSGVYCHQKPLAKFGGSTNPELGDILFVYIESDRSKQVRCNSLLFQAKISSNPNPYIAKNDFDQLELYEKWPKFSYLKAGVLNGKEIDIHPKTINDGAQYLLIDNNPIIGTSGVIGTFPMGCSVPSKQLNLYNDLAKELVEFIQFKSGRTFENEKIKTSDDWTKMIWDLLSIAKNKASSRKNSGLNKFPRSVVNEFDGCCYCIGELSSELGELHKNYKMWGDGSVDVEKSYDESYGGISLILIESKDDD